MRVITKSARAVAAILFAAAWLAPSQAQAGRFEVSSQFSFSRSDYGDGNYSWTRRWGASVGYHFSKSSEIELSFQDVVNRNLVTGYEDTTFHDQIYSINWVQSLLGGAYVVDPYVKVGVGQSNRDASGSYAAGGAPATQVDSLTGVLGAGIRVPLSRVFGLRAEANSYLTGGRISTWDKNFSVNAGFSLYY